MDKKISVRKNYIYNLILTLANLLFPLVTYTYASRVLLPYGIGRAAFASAVVTYFLMFSQLGIPTYGIRICAQEKKDIKKLSQTAKELVIINAVMSVISLCVLLFAAMLLERLYEIRVLLLIYSVTIFASIFEVSWLFSAMEQYGYITKRTLIIKCISVFTIFLLVKDSSDVVMYAFVTAGASLITAMVNFIYSRRFVRWGAKYSYNLKRHIKPIGVFFLMSAATMIYLNLDTVMLGFMTTDDEVGIYNCAVRIKTLLAGVVTALGAVMLPRLSMLIANNDRRTFFEYVSKAVDYTWILSVPMMLYFILYSKECILIISGEEFLRAVPAMRLIMPTIFFIGITNILGIQVMVPLGKEKQVLYSEILGAVTDVLLNFMFIPYLGAAGAALGTLFAELAVLIAQLIFLRKNLREIFAKLSWKKIIIANAIAMCAVLMVKAWGLGHALIALAVSSITYFMVYLAMLVGMKEWFTMDCFSIFINSLRKKQPRR